MDRYFHELVYTTLLPCPDRTKSIAEVIWFECIGEKTAGAVVSVDDIVSMQYIESMPWTIIYLDAFETWLNDQEEGLCEESVAHVGMLAEGGPLLGRPWVDTLKGSGLPNLKEVRFEYKGAPIRILFAFDPKQQAVIMLGGDKSQDKKWYKKNIQIAERLYKEHVEKLAKAEQKNRNADIEKKTGKPKRDRR